MFPPQITASWLIGDDGTPASVVETWCRATAAASPGIAVLEQVAPGRGLLTSGRGALIVAGEPAALGGGGDAWCGSRVEASFARRSEAGSGAVAESSEAPYLLMTRVSVLDAKREDFREWLDIEHSQRQMSVPGNEWYLGYEELGEGHSFMNLWGLLRPDVVESETWRRTSSTPWRTRMLTAIEGTDRAVYRFIVS